MSRKFHTACPKLKFNNREGYESTSYVPNVYLTWAYAFSMSGREGTWEPLNTSNEFLDACQTKTINMHERRWLIKYV